MADDSFLGVDPLVQVAVIGVVGVALSGYGAVQMAGPGVGGSTVFAAGAICVGYATLSGGVRGVKRLLGDEV